MFKNPIIFPIPALTDNYIWTIISPDIHSAVIIDPGESEPVLAFLNAHHYTLSAILVTHHHWDHTRGIPEILKKHPAPVYAPAHDPIYVDHIPMQDQDTINLHNMVLKVLDIPGHTCGHIAYYGDGYIFTGDTLFAGGCGRIFEGTPTQLYESLNKISQFDPGTQLYCGHEYTEKNLAFAQKVDPNNIALQKRVNDTIQQRQQGKPTLPSSIALELRTNPFLRCHLPCIQANVSTHIGHDLKSSLAVFTALRQWKDQQ